jgi:RpiB/LacA/LacB family sugar-phosphate isomerase
MRIAIAGDHHGVGYKAEMSRALIADGHDVRDFGPYSTEPVDYPDYARAVGRAVHDGRVQLGILVCGSGAGVAIAANKVRGVRAALCHDLFTAGQAREDDDANVLCLGAKVVSLDQAVTLARRFVSTPFSGAERHVRRLNKVRAMEAEQAGGPRASGAGSRWPDTPPVSAALDRLEQQTAGARIWKKDTSLWSAAPAVQAAIANRLGWLEAPAVMRRHLPALAEFAAGVRAQGVRDVVLLGMGGSSLAAEVLAHTFGAARGCPALTVLDTTDPGAIRTLQARLSLPHTLFLVSSKSGTTAEMLALYRFFRAEVERVTAQAGAHFVAITDAGTPLERLATEARFRQTFLNPADIGGRFSALSFFGLVPGALIGVDLGQLLDRAEAMVASCSATVPVADNPGLRLGATLGGLAAAGRDKVTLLLSEPIRALGAWLEQLLTESTGKQGRGLIVVHEEPAGPARRYGDDRVFVGVTLGADPALGGVLDELEAGGQPVMRLALADPHDLGAEFIRWELATAAAGVLLEVNPFDEPNVAQAKDATQAALATYREQGRLPEWPADTAEDIARVLRQARPGDYVALLAFLTPEPATTAALQSLRVLVRERTGLATTVGFGPRYLHSTGQLHKGGPPTPILLVLSSEGEHLPIPGERYGFGTLKMAQALGDLATLRAAHRRALWMPLGLRPVEALERLGRDLSQRLGKGEA